MSDYESMQPEAPEWAIDEIHKLKERLDKAEKNIRQANEDLEIYNNALCFIHDVADSYPQDRVIVKAVKEALDYGKKWIANRRSRLKDLIELRKQLRKTAEERDELKELLSECAYSKHTQEAMDQVLFDRIQKALR